MPTDSSAQGGAATCKGPLSGDKVLPAYNRSTPGLAFQSPHPMLKWASSPGSTRRVSSSLRWDRIQLRHQLGPSACTAGPVRRGTQGSCSPGSVSHSCPRAARHPADPGGDYAHDSKRGTPADVKATLTTGQHSENRSTALTLGNRI